MQQEIAGSGDPAYNATRPVAVVRVPPHGFRTKLEENRQEASALDFPRPIGHDAADAETPSPGIGGCGHGVSMQCCLAVVAYA